MTPNPRKYDFTGKVALVTGSSSGIGAEIAYQFALYGARVTITGRDAANLDKVARRLQEASPAKLAPLQIVGDLGSDESLPEKLINQTVAKFGGLDFLVNNAGMATRDGALASPNALEEFDKVYNLNVRAVIRLTQLAVPHLEATKGNVINISSNLSMHPLTLVYCSSKAALDMVTKCSALELGPKGIRVNSINPGLTRTEFGRSVGLTGPAFYDYLADLHIMKRVADPEDIANLASFLASDDARNITGAIYLNDSGYMLSPPAVKIEDMIKAGSGGK